MCRCRENDAKMRDHFKTLRSPLSTMIKVSCDVRGEAHKAMHQGNLDEMHWTGLTLDGCKKHEMRPMLTSFAECLATLSHEQLADVVIHVQLSPCKPSSPNTLPKRMRKSELLDLSLKFLVNAQSFQSDIKERTSRSQDHCRKLMTATNKVKVEKKKKKLKVDV